jgi:hypothetical protein
VGRLTAIGICLALAPQVPERPRFTEAELASATIIVSRQSHGNFAYSSSPTDIRNGAHYTVGVFGDGTVTYTGTYGVGMIGSLTHTVPTDSVRSLVEDFLRADFFRFEESYRFVDHGGLTVMSTTHQDGTELTLLIGTRFKHIYAEQGTPIKLLELARRVEEVADVGRYTGRPLPARGQHTLSGRITDSAGRPLAGATVAVVGHVVYGSTTDTSGWYQIAGIFPDKYVLIATANEFVNAVLKREVRPDEPPADWSPMLTPHEGPVALLKLRSKLNLAVGGTTQNCGEFFLTSESETADTAALYRALQCAATARENGIAFRIIVEQRDLKTWSAFGVAGGPDRYRFLYTFRDSPCTGSKCAQLAAMDCYSGVIVDSNGRFKCDAP